MLRSGQKATARSSRFGGNTQKERIVMTSPAQIIANQRNAQQSTGPRTPDGKAAVARNSTMHGLAGSHIVLPGEDAAHFDALLETLRNEHSPSGATEDFLIQQMAQSQWKLQRAALIEQQILSVAMGEPMRDNASSRLAHIFLDGSSAAKALDRLARYEAAARRLWFQSLKQFTDLRRASSVQKERDVRGRQRHQNLFIDKAIEEFCRPPVSSMRPNTMPDYGTNPIPVFHAANLEASGSEND